MSCPETEEMFSSVQSTTVVSYMYIVQVHMIHKNMQTYYYFNFGASFLM